MSLREYRMPKLIDKLEAEDREKLEEKVKEVEEKKKKKK